MYEDPSDWRVPDWFYDQQRDFALEQDGMWARPSSDQILGFKEVLKVATAERPIQEYLERNKELFMCLMRTGHGNWLFPQPSLLGHFVPDFLYAAGNSGGLSWTYVELESPEHIPFTQKGEFRNALNKAIGQIQDWREMVGDNIRSIRAPRTDGGLGFHGLHPRNSAHIYIGRRHDRYPERYNRRRREYRDNHGIYIESYDTLFEKFLEYWRYYERCFGYPPLS